MGMGWGSRNRIEIKMEGEWFEKVMIGYGVK